MNSDATLLLDLDERNLAHFLSALALAAFSLRVDGQAVESRRCWWPEQPGQFAIQTELPADLFRALLFAKAGAFLRTMRWTPGLGGASSGLPVSGDEIGVNPFIGLSGEAGENTPLKGFSARVLPEPTLAEQVLKLKPADGERGWLEQFDRGAGSWSYDHRVNQHASDAGISSDAEGTGDRDPLYPAIELLSFAAIAFFAPVHAWQVTANGLQACAWARPLPLGMASLAASGRIHGLSGRCYQFAYRGAAHGKGSAYHYFPPATLQST